MHREPAALQTHVTLHDSSLKAEVGRAEDCFAVVAKMAEVPVTKSTEGDIPM